MIGGERFANPYVGLRPFEREDSLRFFGRREQTTELLKLLHQGHFLAVVGSSGCGKSSLVRAGLVPALLGGFLVEERDRWRIATMKPGDTPLQNLAVALADALDDGEAGALRRAIAESHSQGVVDHVVPRLGDDANLLLLIDQFEEVFAFRGTGEDEAGELSQERRRDLARRRAEASDFVDLVLDVAERGREQRPGLRDVPGGLRPLAHGRGARRPGVARLSGVLPGRPAVNVPTSVLNGLGLSSTSADASGA